MIAAGHGQDIDCARQGHLWWFHPTANASPDAATVRPDCGGLVDGSITPAAPDLAHGRSARVD